MQASEINVDSLLNVARHDRMAGNRIYAYILLARHYRTFEPNKSVYYAYKELQEAKQAGDIKEVVGSHFELAYTYRSEAKYDSCRYHFNLAMQISLQNHYIAGECQTYNHLSEYYETIGKKDSSLFCLLKALELSSKTGHLADKADLLNNIGKYYTRQENYDKALYYCLQSLALWQKADSQNVEGILSDIGNIYYARHDYKTALGYYLNSYNHSRTKGSEIGEAFSLCNIGLTYDALKDFPKAIYYYKQSLHFYKLALSKEGIANIYNNLSRVYMNTGVYDQAIDCAKKSLQLGRELHKRDNIYYSALTLADAYARKRDYQTAYDYQKIASVYVDSIYSYSMLQKVADIQTHYEISKKDAETKLLKQQQASLKQKEASDKIELKRRRQLNTLLLLLIILSIVVLTNLLLANRRKKRHYTELERQNAEIAAKSKELQELYQEMDVQRQKLLEANQFKDKIFSIVSHDFRSPLISLQGLLMLMSEGEITTDELKFLSQDLTERVNVTVTFLENLLSWAESQLEGYKPALRTVNIHNTVAEKISLFRAEADSKGIRLINDVDEAYQVFVDANMIKLVLRNLISNAIKFTPENGEIRISCRHREAEFIISVADNGIGIPLSILDKLFSGQKFTSLGTHNEKGTGLGLSLCKEFVEASGGQIWVESTEGEGSIFSFSIPDVAHQWQRNEADAAEVYKNNP